MVENAILKNVVLEPDDSYLRYDFSTKELVEAYKTDDPSKDFSFVQFEE